MNINKYTTFLKVAQLGSITKAATYQGHTQSGVTQLIHSLEKELGVCLFQRNRQGIALTEEGKFLYPFIQSVVDSNQQLEAAVKQLVSTPNNTLRIGTFTSVAVNWLPDIIKEYQKTAPDIHFDLVDCGYNNIEQELEKQQMDISFVPLPLSGHYKCISLYKDRLLAVLPKDHPAAHKKSCPVALFTTEPVIRLIPAIDKDASSVFETNHIKPNTKYTVEDDYAMLAMVEKNLGIGIMPELLLRGNPHSFTAIELDPPSYRTIGIAFPSYETASENAIHFAKFAADWIKKLK